MAASTSSRVCIQPWRPLLVVEYVYNHGGLSTSSRVCIRPWRPLLVVEYVYDHGGLSTSSRVCIQLIVTYATVFIGIDKGHLITENKSKSLNKIYVNCCFQPSPLSPGKVCQNIYVCPRQP